MNNYLIPANSKKGQLIFNIFRWVDLIIVIIGALITLLVMFLVKGDSLFALVVKLLPVGISLLLVLPVANYHNVLVFLQEAYLYFINQKRYHWKGWCASNVTDE